MNRTQGRLRFEHAHVTTDAERAAAGRAARAALPRSAHATFAPASGRDPLAVLEHQNAARLPDLVPLRTARMAQNAFAFYRGGAAIQAADLATEHRTGVDVVICGDAHLANFGIYASPERAMVFDINDFDEAAVGPWEWDIKRLVASVVIAARTNNFTAADARASATKAAEGYRDGIRAALELDVMDRFFRAAAVDSTRQFGPHNRQIVKRALAAAKKRTSARVVKRITRIAPDGSMHIVEDPPVLTHLDPDLEGRVGMVFDTYRRTLPSNVSLLLAQHTITDVARRVVGVGSVGTRCYIVVLTGPRGESLVMQVKEATDSVVNTFGGIAVAESPGIDPVTLAANHGYRVTGNQRILQAVSDPFLGYVTLDSTGFYMRQFRDRNVSFDVAAMTPRSFGDYAAACGTILGRAHARSLDGAFIAGYIGRGVAFTDAVVLWAHAFADLAAADFADFREAVAAGRFPSAE